jgi:hypothetical protein
MDLLLQRHERFRALVPATDLDWARFAGVPHGSPCEVQLRFARSTPLQRWYRGLVGKAAEALDVSAEQLHCDLKFKCGLLERMLAAPAKGTIVVQLRSTAYPAMEDVEFVRYVDLAVEFLWRDYFPSIRVREQQALVAEWAGRRPKLQAPPKIIAA